MYVLFIILSTSYPEYDEGQPSGMLCICGINKKHGSQFCTDYTGSPKNEGQDISHSILYDCHAIHMFT